MQFVQKVREADDKGEKVNKEKIFAELAKQIGVKPEDIKSTLEEFWNTKPRAERSRSDLIAPY